MLNLRSQTPPEWATQVTGDMDTFLLDHAACERKAAATAMSFVVRYPDRPALIEPMVALAREELEHFQQVYRLIAARGLTLAPDEKDGYVNALIKQVRNGRDERLLDRLIIGGIVEARGCERFRLVAEALAEAELAAFYHELARSEARHHALFFRLARAFFDAEVVAARADELLDAEAAAIAAQPWTSRLH